MAEDPSITKAKELWRQKQLTQAVQVLIARIEELKVTNQSRLPSRLAFPLGFFTGALLAVLISIPLLLIINDGNNSVSPRPAANTGPSVLELNNGYGTLENPIPFKEWVIFSEGKAQLLGVRWDARKTVADYNMYNDPPVAGGEYALIHLNVECLIDTCHSYMIEPYLIDDEGNTWSQKSLVLDNDLDHLELTKNFPVDGQLAIEYSKAKSMVALRLQWGNQVAYMALSR